MPEHWEDLNGLMNDRSESELIVVPGSVDNDEPLTMVEAEAERENWDRNIGSGAVSPIPLDAPVSRAHYKLQEVLESDHILGRQYRCSIVDFMSEAPGDRIIGVGGGGIRGGSCLDLGSYPGRWDQVL